MVNFFLFNSERNCFWFHVIQPACALRALGLLLAPIAQSGPFWAQKCCFRPEINFFVHILQFIRYHHDQTLKRQRFRVAHVAEQAPGGLQEPVFGPIKTRKSDFYACIAWHSMVLHGIALYLMVSHSFACHCIVSYGIAWYCIISYGIAWYCIVGFGARAVSRKTPIYFIN